MEFSGAGTENRARHGGKLHSVGLVLNGSKFDILGDIVKIPAADLTRKGVQGYVTDASSGPAKDPRAT